MTVDELCSDLTARLGEQVEQVFTRYGAPVNDITELYQPSPAGFGGQLRLKRSGRRLAWELWLEDGDRWNFHTTDLADACLLYTSPSPRDKRQSRMPSSA